MRTGPDGRVALLRLGTGIALFLGRAGLGLWRSGRHVGLLSSTDGAVPTHTRRTPTAIGLIEGGVGHGIAMTDLEASEPWPRRLARGALAGGVATAAMSAVQFPGAAAGHRRPPPIEITHRLQLLTGRRADGRADAMRGVALHLAFGAAAGAV